MTDKITTESIMEQAQVFASTWSSVGGPFDTGDTMERAEAEKVALREMVERLAAAEPAAPQAVPVGKVRIAEAGQHRLPDGVVDWLLHDANLPRSDMPDTEALRNLVQLACRETVARMPDFVSTAPARHPDSVRGRLHTFLNGAAGEGYMLDGVDAAALYVELFPDEYAAAVAQIDTGTQEVSGIAAMAASKQEGA